APPHGPLPRRVRARTEGHGPHHALRALAHAAGAPGRAADRGGGGVVRLRRSGAPRPGLVRAGRGQPDRMAGRRGPAPRRGRVHHGVRDTSHSSKTDPRPACHGAPMSTHTTPNTGTTIPGDPAVERTVWPCLTYEDAP